MLIEVFKAGTHTDSRGNTQTYTTEMLDRLVYNYAEQLAANPNNLAPLVKGHPQADEPAHGWVKKLCRRGKKLIAQIEGIDPKLVDEIKSDKYKGFSIALYSDMQLRHIGVLGAVPPAVKGLNENGVMYFQSDKTQNNATKDDNELKEYLNTTRNLTNLPENIDKQAPIDKQAATVAEVDKDDLINKLQEANTKLLEQLKEMKQKHRKYEFNEYVNSIAAASYLIDTPAQKAALSDIFELAHTNAATASGEFAAAEQTPMLVQKIKNFIELLEHANPPAGGHSQRPELLAGLNFAEQAAATDTLTTAYDNPQQMDTQRHKMHIKAMDFCHKHPAATYQDAIEHILTMNNY